MTGVGNSDGWGERGHASFLADHEPRPLIELPPHPLMPHGYDFNGDEMLVLPSGVILPSVAFSQARFQDLEALADIPQLPHGEELVIFAQYLTNRKGFAFVAETGCWDLPLKAEYDDKRRARYPHVTIKALGLYNLLAHRATIHIFRGEPIRQKHVDHLCRRHACCNPYHLEAVGHADNTKRGNDARTREVQPTLFQLNPGMVAVAQLVMGDGNRI